MQLDQTTDHAWNRLVSRYGEKEAKRVMRLMVKGGAIDCEKHPLEKMMGMEDCGLVAITSRSEPTKWGRERRWTLTELGCKVAAKFAA